MSISAGRRRSARIYRDEWVPARWQRRWQRRGRRRRQGAEGRVAGSEAGCGRADVRCNPACVASRQGRRWAGCRRCPGAGRRRLGRALGRAWSAAVSRSDDRSAAHAGQAGDAPREAHAVAASPLVTSAFVVGTGLIGTSVGLALRAAGVAVWLEDLDPRSVELAAALGAGIAAPPSEPVDVVVLAAPPGAVPDVLERLLSRNLGQTYTDVASVKSQPLAEIKARNLNLTSFVGGHPMAGRERSGAIAARGDLFVGRPWVLTPTPETSPDAVARAQALAVLCGARPVTMSPAAHDAAVALVSHAPHVVASLMAARLAEAAEPAVALAGQGVADVTRVAEGDWRLWTQILTANAAAVTEVLEALRADLDRAIDALRGTGAGTDPSDRAGAETVVDLLQRGITGRARLPGKHGGAPTKYAVVAVLVPDRPGELARLFRDADAVGANIEDVLIEHASGVLFGLVELSVQPEAAAPLADALRSAGWLVQS